MTEIIAFTARGAALAERLRESLGPNAAACAVERYCTGGVGPLAVPLGKWTEERFRRGNTLVFIGAAGIAVRAIAPFVRSKDTDPAVLCIDEGGRYVIPLLSGHLGGANRLAGVLAGICGGAPVITTATDTGGVFSPDAWAAEQGCAVTNIGEIKRIAAALLDGEAVGLSSDFPLRGPLPGGVVETENARCGIEIAFRANNRYAHTLHLVPRCVVAGIGCRRGVPKETIAARLDAVLEERGIPRQAVCAVATVDRKADEPGLLELCAELRAELIAYTPQQLMAAEGDFTPSERVERLVGVDNVCERAAALAAAGPAGKGVPVAGKSAADGVTVALARRFWTGKFSAERNVDP